MCHLVQLVHEYDCTLSMPHLARVTSSISLFASVTRRILTTGRLSLSLYTALSRFLEPSKASRKKFIKIVNLASMAS